MMKRREFMLSGAALAAGTLVMQSAAAAPGQIEADDLSRVLNIIHTANQA